MSDRYNPRLTIPMLVRAEQLYSVGLSYGAIAAVLALDYDRPVNKETLRKQLRRSGILTDERRASNYNLNRVEAAA